MKFRRWALGLLTVVGLIVLAWWSAQPSGEVNQDELAGWTLLEGKPPASFLPNTAEGLAQLVELQLFARRIAGVQEARGPLKEELPLPTAFNLPEVSEDVLKNAIPLVLRRERGRWDDTKFLPRLAFLLEQLQARSSRHLAVSFFPSRVPMPTELTEVIPKAQLFLLSGSLADRQSAATRKAFEHLMSQGARVLRLQNQPKDGAEAAALLVLASLGSSERQEALAMDPAGLDAEAELKARLPGGLRIQAIGRAGQIHYDERWMRGPGAKRFLAADYRKRTAGWLSANGKEVLILLAHKTGMAIPRLDGLTPEPSVSLIPLGRPGYIGFSPFAPRLPVLQWQRALITGAAADRHFSDGKVKIYLRLDPTAGTPALDGLQGPAGWRLRLQSPSGDG